MTIEYYNNIKVSLIKSTNNPTNLIYLAADITTTKNFGFNERKNIGLIPYLFNAKHQSLFEHIYYTFLIENASRSFLSQITRHRIASFTSGSQHYQNYKDYNFSISPNESFKQFSYYNAAFEKSKEMYNKLIDSGIPKHEARQVLPNAIQNNLLMTINARSLINFLNLRLCNRNTLEIKIVANKIHKIVKNHFPELFNLVGTDCFISKCKQQHLSCGGNKNE